MAQTVLITGAGKGLGLSLAVHFLRAGFRVFAGINPSDSDALKGSASEMLTSIPLDVSQMDSIRAAAVEVARQSPALDILINNAGVHLEPEGAATLETCDFADGHLEKTLAVNTFGPLRVAQQFYPLLAAGQRKLLMNISSEAGSITDCGRESEFAYCMSKAALNMQSKLLQNHLGARGFKVLAIHPGWMRTDMGGPQAAISPEESADGIFTLATQAWSPNDPIYLDYRGNALRW